MNKWTPHPQDSQPVHQQTIVGVNTKVDVGVANLVKALSGFPKLMTVESCEGGKDTGAFVIFNYGANWRELVEFVFSFFGPQLAKRIGDDAGVIVVYGHGGSVRVNLTTRPGATDRTSAAIVNMVNSEAEGGFDACETKLVGPRII